MSQGTFGYERCECLPHAERIVYQGLKGTHGNLVAVQFLSQYPRMGSSHVGTFGTTVRAVDEGTGDYTVLPIGNSTAGSIVDNHGALAKREVPVVGEYLLPVRHALLACGGVTLTDIRTVYSHPQGIKQCAPSFEEHPEIEAVAVLNITVAAQLVQAMGKSGAAATTSACTGQIYGLRVLIPILNYRAENTTRFLIVGKEKLYLCGVRTVSLMMEARHETGTFYHVLGALYTEGINLFCLTTCPVPEISWAYRLFFDFSRSLEETTVQRAF